MKRVLLGMSMAIFSLCSHSSDLDLEVYYSSQVVERGTPAQLNWHSDNADSCANLSGLPLQTSGQTSTLKSDLGYFSSTIKCSDSAGNTISKTADLYVVHKLPKGYSSKLEDAGGGRLYSEKILPTDSDINHNLGCDTVATLSELKNCLDPNSTYNTVYIDGTAVIRLDPSHPLVIPEGYTIASDRGINSAPGGALILNQDPTVESHRAIKMKSNTRLTGLRIRGPHQSYQAYSDNILVGGVTIGYSLKHEYVSHNKQGFNPNSDFLNVENVVIDNNLIYGWSYFGVGVFYKARGVMIKNNLIRNNQGKGLGYGVLTNGTEPDGYSKTSVKVHENVFVNNRHDIASSGWYGTSYQAAYNIVFNGPELSDGPASDNHRFDVHGCINRHTCEFENGVPTPNFGNDGSYNHYPSKLDSSFPKLEAVGYDAANYINVVNNIFSLARNRQKAIRLSGIPHYLSYIRYNHFSHSTVMATKGSQTDKAIEFRDFRNPAGGKNFELLPETNSFVEISGNTTSQ